MWEVFSFDLWFWVSVCLLVFVNSACGFFVLMILLGFSVLVLSYLLLLMKKAKTPKRYYHCYVWFYSFMFCGRVLYLISIVFVQQKSFVVEEESDDDMEETEEPKPKVEVEEEEEDEIVESDVELEGDTVEPDNDPPQKVR